MNDSISTELENKVEVEQERIQTKKYPVGCLRGVLLFFAGIVLSVLTGLASGQSLGVLWGIIIGIVCLLIFTVIILFVINRSKKLTIVDCALPIVISIISAIAFAPFDLFSGNLFSTATCIFSGVLLSVGLALYKYDKLQGHYLILPMLTFVYEILPIQLPTDLDNILALGVSTLDIVVGKFLHPTNRLKK